MVSTPHAFSQTRHGKLWTTGASTLQLRLREPYASGVTTTNRDKFQRDNWTHSVE